MDEILCIAPGTVLSENYQIIKQIGKGGMGHVYLAYDTQLELQVAIKVISHEFLKTLDEDYRKSALKRFESEAKIAAKIDHPNVIRIFGFKRERIDIVDQSYDIDYLVMEYLSGRTLRNTMDVSGFEHEEEIKDWIDSYMIPILDGLEKIHEEGITHRDIKPENFLMKDNTPKIADFGLSMAVDFPSVTGSVSEILGTMTYMAPEQFYNFSLAKEKADIFAIGKIFYEIVDGKIPDKAPPFKQSKLPNPDSPFLAALNRIIMDATEENPIRRTKSAKTLKKQLRILLDGGVNRIELLSKNKKTPRVKRFIWPAALLAVLGAVIVMHFSDNLQPNKLQAINLTTEKSEQLISVRPLSYSDKKTGLLRMQDGSSLHFIPPVELKLSKTNVFGMEKITVSPFYLSEAPVTNQQYVDFLNQIVDRVRVEGSDVYLDNRLLLKLNEKIRGYKPILYENDRFTIKEPMHSACAVLNVTGNGAEVYATHFGMRLPLAREWFYVMSTGQEVVKERILLPVPIVTYKKNIYGIRGIDQLAEWGRVADETLVILGKTQSTMIKNDLVMEKNSFKYYTDTGFRVAKNAK